MRALSIVVPVYHNESNLPSTIPQLLALDGRLSEFQLELVFVDDGSPDRSLEILLDFQSRRPEIIKIVKLARNFGAMAAVQAGFAAATGDCVGVIAADLQDPPELFDEMVGYWERGNKVVLAFRQGREDGFLQNLLSSSFWWLVRRFAIPNYPVGGFDVVLIDRQVVQELNSIREKNTNLLSLAFWLGFRPVLIPYVRRRRSDGRSRWTLSKKMKLFVDTFVGFSYLPIRLFSGLGMLVAASGLTYGGLVLLHRILYGAEVPGFTAIFLTISVMSGLQITMLGILGEYLWRVLDEVRRRPPYVVDQIFDRAISAWGQDVENGEIGK